MIFAPDDHAPASRPAHVTARWHGDTRHAPGNITARARRPLTHGEIGRLMRERPGTTR